MQLKLRSLTLINFKGVRNQQIVFGSNTTISGENGTGKTTFFDAYLWLLFGKDSNDRQDFSIKTFDKDNNILHKLDHEVQGEFDYDGTTLNLRRVYREKWVKKKGSEVAEFNTHETDYFYNGVPMQKQEYTAKINAILDESIAKLITSPLFFNTLKWEEKRVILTKIVGDISDSEVAGNNAEYVELLKQLSGKTLKEFKAEIAAKKKSVKDVLEHIPSRIDEAQRTKPVVPVYAEIEKEIEDKKRAIENIENQIEDKSKAQQTQLDEIQKKQQELHEMKMRLQSLKQQEDSSKLAGRKALDEDVDKYANEYSRINRDIEYQERELSNYNSHINTKTIEKDGLLQKLNTENAKTFVMDENAISCPTCKREFDSDKVHNIREDLEKNFNNNKLSIIDDIKKKGSALKQLIIDITTQRDEVKEKIALLTDSKNDVQKKYEAAKLSVQNYVLVADVTLTNQITELSTQIDMFVVPTLTGADTSYLRAQRTTLNADITALTAKLSVKDQIEKIDKRIAELQQQEKDLSQELAQLEKTEFTILEFDKKKMDAIETKLNSMFQVVKFKMFDTQINGGEKPTCECLVNGVPFSDVNTAGKINAGLDIINTLTNFYNTYAPIFIDNRESVNDLLVCKSQIINLVVSRDKSLTIS